MHKTIFQCLFPRGQILPKPHFPIRQRLRHSIRRSPPKLRLPPLAFMDYYYNGWERTVCPGARG